MILHRRLAIAALMLGAGSAAADAPEILSAKARETAAGWTVSATIAHPDTGWDHYADGFRVETGDGTVLGMRTLHHPHVEEQPFTRSLGGIAVPAGVDRLLVRARCNVDGWADAAMPVTLPR